MPLHELFFNHVFKLNSYISNLGKQPLYQVERCYCSTTFEMACLKQSDDKARNVIALICYCSEQFFPKETERTKAKECSSAQDSSLEALRTTSKEKKRALLERGKSIAQNILNKKKTK